MSGTRLVCVALLFALASAANPTVKIGLTLSKCGLTAQAAEPTEQSLRWWVNYTNTQGGIVINGTAHDIELVMYISTVDRTEEKTIIDLFAVTMMDQTTR